MIIVKIELHSAVTHKITELARMKICNDGLGSNNYRNYDAFVYRGRCKEHLDRETVLRHKKLLNWPAPRFHVWNLVAKLLKEMGYSEGQ